MGLLDMLGGLSGSQSGRPGQAALLQAVVSMLGTDSSIGGLAGLLQHLDKSGLGDVVSSWVGTGQNTPISPQQLQAALPSDMFAGLAQQFGGSQGDLMHQLAQLLPQVVDRLTPDGQVPQGGLGNVAELLGGMMKP